MIVEPEKGHTDGHQDDVPSTAPTVHAVVGGESGPVVSVNDTAEKMSPPTANVIAKENSVGNDDSSTLTTENCSSNNEEIGDTEDLNDEPQKTFPQRLMEMLNDPANNKAITWLPHGKAFSIYKKKSFSEEVLPKYFKACKYTSFTRKLNRWGFTRVTRGPEMGSYFHPKFLREDPKMCLQMCSNSGASPPKFSPMLFPGQPQLPGGAAAISMMAAAAAGAGGAMPGMMGFMPGMLPFGMPMPTPPGTAPGITTVAGAPLDAATAMAMQQQQMAMMQQLQQFQMQQFQLQMQIQQQQQQQGTANPAASAAAPVTAPTVASSSAAGNAAPIQPPAPADAAQATAPVYAAPQNENPTSSASNSQEADAWEPYPQYQQNPQDQQGHHNQPGGQSHDDPFHQQARHSHHADVQHQQHSQAHQMHHHQEQHIPSSSTQQPQYPSHQQQQHQPVQSQTDSSAHPHTVQQQQPQQHHYVSLHTTNGSEHAYHSQPPPNQQNYLHSAEIKTS